MKQPTYSKKTPADVDEQYAQKLMQFSVISTNSEDLFAQTLSKLTLKEDAIHTRHMLEAASGVDGIKSRPSKRNSLVGSLKLYASLGVIAVVFVVGGFALMRSNSNEQTADVATQSSSIAADGSVANATSAIAATVQEEVSLSNAVFASSTSALDQIKSQTEALAEVSNDNSF